MKCRYIIFINFLIVLNFFNQLQAQINEPQTKEVYNYLYRMAAKGLIQWNDIVLPLDRHAIADALVVLKSESMSKLSYIERKELDFYITEYYYDIHLLNSSYLNNDKIHIFQKDESGRFRTIASGNKQMQLFVDPVVGYDYIHYNNNHNLTTYGGFRMWGMIGKHFGYNVFFRDVTESGDSLNANKYFTPDQGIVNTSRNPNQLNYSNLNFNLGYRWKNGIVSVGKDNLNWGYGESGKIVLSSKAPSFFYLRLHYEPFKWLDFDYFNGWLNSDVIDSSRSYATGTNTAGGYREIFRSKYIASHSLTFKTIKGLNFSIGESMVYSDKLDVGYLIPINFFKAYDQYVSSYSLNGGSNGQIFAQISSRNQIKNTHLYATLFVDEIRLSKIFDRVQNRNQIAYTLGANKTDVFIKYLTIGGEYTRIRGGVYNNIIPAQTYTNNSYSLGDWMGQNADRIYLYINYTPLPRLKTSIWYQYARKGSDWTLDQQYNQQPEPPFLFDQLFSIRDIGFNCYYELIQTLRINFNITQSKSYLNKYNYFINNHSISFGISYGL
jgi:hypothetical protein